MKKRCSQDSARNYTWKTYRGEKFWRCMDCPKLKEKLCPGWKYAATDIPTSCRLRKAIVSWEEFFPAVQVRRSEDA